MGIALTRYDGTGMANRWFQHRSDSQKIKDPYKQPAHLAVHMRLPQFFYAETGAASATGVDPGRFSFSNARGSWIGFATVSTTDHDRTDRKKLVG